MPSLLFPKSGCLSSTTLAKPPSCFRRPQPHPPRRFTFSILSCVLLRPPSSVILLIGAPGLLSVPLCPHLRLTRRLGSCLIGWHPEPASKAWLLALSVPWPGLPARPACPPCKLACSCRLSVPLPPPQHRPKGAKVCPFLCHLSRRVADLSTSPSESIFLGFLLTAVWASLRWGDLLWTPPGRLHLQLSHGGILGTAVRTKTTNRAMPFGFLIVGLSGTPSSNWGIRFFNLLRQSLADTLSVQPGRVIDFLPARLGGSDSRPLLLDPCERHLAVPRLLSLLSAHWSANSDTAPPQQFALYGAHSCKATVLSWSRQMSLDRTLRRIQGHHRLSGADRSVELYGRDDIRPMLDLQAQVINHVRAGFRPLQPLARGSSVPLPDFHVQLPSAPVPTLADPAMGPVSPPPAFPPSPGPLPERDLSPASAPSPLPLEDADQSPVDSLSSASVVSADSEDEVWNRSAPRRCLCTMIRYRRKPPLLHRHDRTWLLQPSTYIFTTIVPTRFTLPGLPPLLTRLVSLIRSRLTSTTAQPVALAPRARALRPSAAPCRLQPPRVCTALAVRLCLLRSFGIVLVGFALGLESHSLTRVCLPHSSGLRRTVCTAACLPKQLPAPFAAVYHCCAAHDVYAYMFCLLAFLTQAYCYLLARTLSDRDVFGALRGGSPDRF